MLAINNPRILVLGDAMLDRYTWGSAERVSPEAPVLVLRADDREVRLGGAASVAILLRALEVETTLAAVIGDDHDGRTIRRLLDDAKIDTTPLLIDSERPTTTKERFLGRSEQRQAHQMLRVDSESQVPLDNEHAARLLNSLAVLIPQYDAVLISDYGKGVCTETVLAEVVAMGRETGIPILVDPARGADFATYRGATLIKPNRLEAELAIGHTIRTPDAAMRAAKELRERYEIESVIITLDQDGMVFATADGCEHQAITPRAVCDITGAGDTVLATLGLGLASNRCGDSPLTLSAIVTLANIAGGMQVAQPGVTPIPRAELFREFDWQTNNGRVSLTPNESGVMKAKFLGGRTYSTTSKLITLDEAEQFANEYRSKGKTIVFTNGCFDLLHVGHVTMLEESACQGDVLFVAVNSDQSVRRVKGNDRPVIPEHERARMLSSLASNSRRTTFPHDLGGFGISAS